MQAEEAAHAAAMSARAEKKWNQLDVDSSGQLDGEEVLALAEWVWCSFRPGESITPQTRVHEASKLMGRCDLNGNGVIDKGEFGSYYDHVVRDMFRFHKGRAVAKAKQPTKPVASASSVPANATSAQASSEDAAAQVAYMGRGEDRGRRVWHRLMWWA